MGEIRDRITWPTDRAYDEHALCSEWAAGNLVPADDAEALFAALTALAGPGRPASEMRAEMARQLDENPAYVKADEVADRIAAAVEAERERCAGVAKAAAKNWRDIDKMGLPISPGIAEARARVSEGIAAAIMEGKPDAE